MPWEYSIIDLTLDFESCYVIFTMITFSKVRFIPIHCKSKKRRRERKIVYPSIKPVLPYSYIALRNFDVSNARIYSFFSFFLLYIIKIPKKFYIFVCVYVCFRSIVPLISNSKFFLYFVKFSIFPLDLSYLLLFIFSSIDYIA